MRSRKITHQHDTCGCFCLAIVLILSGSLLPEDAIAGPLQEATTPQMENFEADFTVFQQYDDITPDDLDLDMSNPGSISERLEEDSKPVDTLFPGGPASDSLRSWYDMKANLDERLGLKFGISNTVYYQKASHTYGPEKEAASYDIDVSGTWTFGRETTSPTTLGFDFFWRDTLHTDLPPQTLFTQFGSLYSSAAPYGIEEPVLGELWIQQVFENKFGFRAGKIFPITAYDFFPFKNFRTDFIDFNSVTNSAIPLPGNGLGAFVQLRPQLNTMIRFGIHDANADVQESGFDTYNGELFTIFEVGYDTGLLPRSPGTPPQGHVHFSLWHQDEREDFNIDSGWGFGVSAVQRFGQYSPFIRYGYADVTATGPTPVQHMVNAGLVIDNIFGQDSDRVGIGYTWADPADDLLDIQHTIDAYYRVQLTREIEIGPTFEAIFNPVRNAEEDFVFVWGLRGRIAF